MYASGDEDAPSLGDLLDALGDEAVEEAPPKRARTSSVAADATISATPDATVGFVSQLLACGMSLDAQVVTSKKDINTNNTNNISGTDKQSWH